MCLRRPVIGLASHCRILRDSRHGKTLQHEARGSQKVKVPTWEGHRVYAGQERVKV